MEQQAATPQLLVDLLVQLQKEETLEVAEQAVLEGRQGQDAQVVF
jgi:hypothetical protein